MNRLYRGLFTLTLLLGLLIGLAGPSLIPVKAAPVTAVLPGDVLISEFRFLGPTGASDEFIELYNPKNVLADITGLKIMGSNNAGTTSTRATLGSVTLQPGQHYLFVNAGASAELLALQDATYSIGITADGGIALTLADGTTIIDAVGLSSGSAYLEGAPLSPLSGTADQSYERKLGGASDSCVDTGDNSSDFSLLSPSAPQNSSSPWSLCGVPVPATPTITPTFTGTPTFTETPTFTATQITFTLPPPTNTPTITPTLTITTPIISEVAWAGTKASPNDEWIELYNPGSAAVDLSGWRIVAKDESPLIPLTGSIPPGGFYLIERGDDGVVQDVTADLHNIAFDPLSDEGETLYLQNASRTLIDSANKSGIAWPAGQTGGNFPTMERAKTNGQIAPDGTLAWVTNNGTVKNGHDAAGNAIYGTPKQANWPLVPTITPTFTITPTRTRTPTGTISTATPTATPTLGLIINEVGWMGTVAKSTDEWIELYNPGATAISLTGWKLVSTDGLISIDLQSNDSDNTIHAGEYYVIAPSSAFTDVVIRQNVSVSLNNNGVSLKLLSPSGVLVDTANSDGGTWPAGIASPTYATMERHAATLDHASSWYTFAGTAIKHDRDNNLVKGTPGYANWAASVTATPTKTPTGTPRPPTAKPVGLPPIVATLVINEFLPRAGFDWNKDGKVDVFDEYIEIANLGPIDANLANWKLDDLPNGGSSPFTLPSRTLKPGERAIFYASQTNVLLSDGGDTVRLLNPNNVIKDAHTYSLIKVADQSICRLPDINGSWYTDCVPTPNARNSRTGTVPSAPPGTGLEEPLCQLPDTLPVDFQLAECFGFGSNMWNPAYWDIGAWTTDRFVPQNGSKWDTFIE